jgi:potassium channel subfamily K
MTLMINMLGHWLGHYPDTFELTDSQRTLILQTMMFFAWLAGGAAVFSTVEEDANTPGWSFTDAVSDHLCISLGPDGETLEHLILRF